MGRAQRPLHLSATVLSGLQLLTLSCYVSVVQAMVAAGVTLASTASPGIMLRWFDALERRRAKARARAEEQRLQRALQDVLGVDEDKAKASAAAVAAHPLPACTGPSCQAHHH